MKQTDTISIDFGKEINEQNNNIQVTSKDSTILINQVCGSLFIAFFGQKISFKSIDFNNIEQKVVLELLDPSTVTMKFNENTNISIHNRFNSNKFLAASFTLILNKNCNITFLKCSYNERQFKMNIIQDFPTTYFIKSSYLPANLHIGPNSISDIYFDTLNLKLKQIYTSSSLNLISSQKNPKIYIQSLASNNSDIFLNTNSDFINFEKIDLKNSILNIPNSTINCNLCFIKNSSQINCTSLSIYRSVIHPIENNICFVAENLSLEIIILNNQEGVKMKGIIISKTPTAPSIIPDNIFTQPANFVKRNYLYQPSSQLYTLDLVNKHSNVYNRLIITESNVTVDEAYVVRFKDLQDFLRKSMEYSNMTLYIEILDNYKDKTIKIANIARYRRFVTVHSQYFCKLSCYDSKDLSFINIDNVYLDDSYFVSNSLTIRNSIVSENNKITVLGKLITMNSSLLTPDITYDSGLFKFMSDIIVDKNIINDSMNYIKIKGDFGLVAYRKVQINYDHNVNNIEFEVPYDTYIISDIKLNNPTFISAKQKVYLDFKYLPTNLTLQTSEYIIFDKTEVSNETNLNLKSNILIDSQSKRDVIINNMHLQPGSLLSLTDNVKMYINVLNVSTIRKDNKITLNTRTLSLLEDSFTTIDKIRGVEFIDIHYSVFKLGFMHINSLKTNNYNKTKDVNKNPIVLNYVQDAKKAICEGGLHVRFYNDALE